MKTVVQRVNFARVQVDGETVGEIGKGLLIFLGVGKNDGRADCERLADKLAKLRIFADENGKTNLSADDVGGDFLVVSQFTLYAELGRSGNRPSFSNAGGAELANELYEYFCECCAERIKGKVERGVFGADMKITLENDGPFTVTPECVGGEIL